MWNIGLRVPVYDHIDDRVVNLNVIEIYFSVQE